MTLDELIKALADYRALFPQYADKPVATEGCDCYGQILDVDYYQTLDAVVIFRDGEYQHSVLPIASPNKGSIAPLPIAPKKLPGPLPF